MRLGAHVSVAGGVYKAFERAAKSGCDSMLLFTKSNRQWDAKPITDQETTDYQREKEKYPNIYPVAVHASYLINIASPNPELWEKSYRALQDEVERADRFGLSFLTFHPGSFMDSSEKAGIDNIAKALKRLLEETVACETVVCLENMAGQGTNLGHRFEQLAEILSQVGDHPRLGVCFDSCHAFAAGYDLRTPEAYAGTMSTFDRLIGLHKIRCFHFNDSEYGLGSRKDRHAHIGQGEIGLAGFANFVNDPRWAGYGAQLETDPTGSDDAGNPLDMNQINLAALRSLMQP